MSVVYTGDGDGRPVNSRPGVVVVVVVVVVAAAEMTFT